MHEKGTFFTFYAISETDNICRSKAYREKTNY